MANHKCQKGWILTPSPTDGEYVPFFVQVREQDVVYDEDNLPDELKNIYNSGNNKKFLTNNKYWKFDYKNWNIKLKSDGSYEATKKISIGEEFETPVTSNINILSVNLELPFETKNDNEFTVQFTISSTNIRIGTSVSSISIIEDDEFDTLQCYLQNAVYSYNSDFKVTHVYDDSCLYIKISGNINI